MKYDAQLTEAAKILPGAQNILIALPTQPTIDHLAAGLALFLSLEQAGKKAAIVTDGVIRVGESFLFGIGQVQNRLPQTSGGNLTITLGGVVAADGTVPTLQKLDWYPNGQDLNLVFHVNPGQKFEPNRITPSYDGGSFNLIFVLGAPSLEALGTIYTSNQAVFSNSPVINIDNQASNSQFGKTNVVDPAASSLSEMVSQILPFLQLPFEGDIATNILAGIFAATNNLQGENMTADTYMTVAATLQVGGKKPVLSNMPTPQVTTAPTMPTPQAMPQTPNVGSVESFTVPPVVTPQNEPQPSAEETPTGEGVESATPESDWLTPKIFKGSSIG